MQQDFAKPKTQMMAVFRVDLRMASDSALSILFVFLFPRY